MLPRVLWYCHELSRNQWLEPPDLRRLQEKRLREIVDHSYNNVPLYREKFDVRGIKPGDIRTLEDLQKLPFTTKEEVREGLPDKTLAKNIDSKNCIRASTSGTSGGSMPVYYDRRFLDYCLAAWRWRKRPAIGAMPWHKMMEITYSGSVAPKKEDQIKAAKPQHRSKGRESLGPMVYLLRNRQKVVTIRNDASEVLDLVLKFDPKLILGTASYFRLLGEAMADRGLESLGNRIIRTEGEVTDEETRNYLERSFKCKVFDEYSSWDFANGAWQCARREGYHIDADLLLIEVVKGDEPAAAGEQGEIVVTNLLNYAMPLIRYRVGDIGILDENLCSCGRTLPLLRSIEGRSADCFTLSDGRIITPKTLMTAIQGTPGVSRYQAVQQTNQKIRIELMRRVTDGEVSRDELTTRCKRVLGHDQEIEVVITDRKDLKAKFRPVISKQTVASEPRWTVPRQELNQL